MHANQKRELMTAARAAARRAYAPYSGLRVGAAVLSDAGLVFQGCNVENASYGLTICAERAALCAAIAAGARNFRALAVVALARRAPLPCGACRQALAEFCPPGFVIFTAGAKATGRVRRYTLGKLLPKAFKL